MENKVPSQERASGTAGTENLLGSKTRIKEKDRDSGQALVFLVITLPLIALLLSGLTNHLILLKSKTEHTSNCRTITMMANERIKTGFYSLMNLNSKARNLRKRYQRALRKVALAPSPPQRIAALAELSAVVSLQLALKAKQFSIIQTSKTQARSVIVRSALPLSVSTIPFSLEASPKSSTTPSYYPAWDLEKRQIIQAKWKVLKPNQQEGVCGSYIKKRGGSFQVKIAFPDIS